MRVCKEVGVDLSERDVENMLSVLAPTSELPRTNGNNGNNPNPNPNPNPALALTPTPTLTPILTQP